MSVDALTATYRLPCPDGGTSRVRLSSFREIERLPGPSHPALYRIVYRCSCGDEHVALVGHDELDWAPLGLDGGVTYVNLMTSRHDDLVGRADGARVPADRQGRVALELLLLPRGRAATRHAVGVPPARAVGRDRRGRGRLPGLRLDDDQPRQPAPRRRPVPFGRERRRRRPRLRGGRAPHARRVPRRAGRRGGRCAAAGAAWVTRGSLRGGITRWHCGCRSLEA